MIDKSIIKKYIVRFKREIVLADYYSKQSKNGKSLWGNIFDLIFFGIIAILIIMLFNGVLFPGNIFTLLIALILSGSLIYVFIYFNLILKAKKKKEINEEIISEEMANSLDKMNSKDFILYVKEILEVTYNTKLKVSYDTIDLIGEINDSSYGVKCIKIDKDQFISFRDIERYLLDIEDLGIHESIIVTNGSFMDDVKDNTNIVLIDKDILYSLVDKVKGPITDKEIEQLIINTHRTNKEKSKSELIFKRKGKVKKLLTLGITLYLFSKIVMYSTYYKILAYIALSMALVLFVLNIVNKRKTNKV